MLFSKAQYQLINPSPTKQIQLIPRNHDWFLTPYNVIRESNILVKTNLFLASSIYVNVQDSTTRFLYLL